VSKQSDDFRMLLDGFCKAEAQATKTDAAEANQELRAFRAFFPGYDEALERWRKQQEDKADDFNLLAVMNLTGKELLHSRILAWLLDWDMTSLGTHAQGSLGFRFFLEEFGLPVKYAEGTYRVRREERGDESRIDVEVAERRKFVIHIENKIGAGEGDDQTNREWRDLQERAESLDCTEYHALYLTPNGMKPSNANFHPISWRQVATVLDRFAAEVKPKDVSLFAQHYAKVLRTHIIPEVDEKENDDANEQVQ